MIWLMVDKTTEPMIWDFSGDFPMLTAIEGDYRK